jgi:hypothetical protein
LHKKDIHGFCCSSNHFGDQIKNEMGGACGRYGGKGKHTDFGGENEGKRPFGRPRYRQENNIAVDLEEKE